MPGLLLRLQLSAICTSIIILVRRVDRSHVAALYRLLKLLAAFCC